MKKIYVADVHDESAQTRLALLEQAGAALGVDVEVVRFDDGISLHERAMREPPALVVVDVLLPAVSGLAVCRLLKFETHTRDVPVYLSGWSAEPDLEARMAAVGADGFLPKPWTAEAVSGMLADRLVAA